MHIISWNVNGYKARKEEVKKLLMEESPDICCIMETKTRKINDEYDGYEIIQNNGDSGRNGIAVMIKNSIIKNLNYDIINDAFGKGRVIILHLNDLGPMIFLYVPNSGRELKTLEHRLQWDKELEHTMENLNKEPLLIAGDLNVIHTDDDIHEIKGRERLAGCTEEEKEDFNHMINKFSMVDTYRLLHPKAREYTFWSYMGSAKEFNKGWRLDYILANSIIKEKILSSGMLNAPTKSDHCPIYCKLDI